MFPSKAFVLIIVLSALLVACGPALPAPADAPPGLTAWVDAPLHGSTIPEAAYNIVFSASSSNGAVDHFEVQVNGIAEDNVAPIFETEEGEAKYYYSQYNWLPPAPGSYLIQVRAVSGDEMGLFAEAQVQVGELQIAAVPPPDEAPEELPPPNENGPALLSFDTNLFYYGASCDPRAVSVAIQVPNPEANSVVLFYRLRGMDSEERTDWEAAAMNPGSEGFFRLTVPSSAIPDRDMFQSAYFQMQIVGTKLGGEEILRTEVLANQVILLACGEEAPIPAPAGPGDEDAPPPDDRIIRIVPFPPTPTPIPPPS